MDIQLEDRSVSEQLSEIFSYYRERHAATTWLVTPASAPPDIAEYLRDHLCMRRERWLGMAVRPWQIEWSSSMPRNAEISRVTTQRELRSWASIVGDVYYLPELACELLYWFFAHGHGRNLRRWRLYLALVDGNPVATATTFLGSREAGLYLVGTLPEHRGNGLARAITVHAARAAVGAGYDRIVLQSTPDGHRLYRKLGFETSHSIDAYRWESSAVRRGVQRLLSLKR